MPFRLHISIGLIVITLVVYAQNTGHGFISLDDMQYVTDNPMVRQGLTFEGLIWAFDNEGYASNFHPLTWLSLMLDSELFGLENPGGFHAVNIALHLLNVLILFFVLDRATGETRLSAFVAALFAIHPIHVESVAWVAQRKDVLAGLFWILAMGTYTAYATGRGRLWYVATIGAFVLGLMSKPTVLTLPCALLLLDFWPLKRIGSAADAMRCVIDKIPLFTLSLVLSVVVYRLQQGAMATEEQIETTYRMGNAIISYCLYLIKTFWPFQLAVFYPHSISPGQSLHTSSQLALSAAMLLVISGIAAWSTWRGKHYITVGWLWFLGTMVPMIGIVQVGGAAMADRYTYIPSIGLSIMIVWSVRNLAAWWRIPTRAMIAASTFVLLVLVAIGILQVRRWENDITLFKHTVAVTRNNAMAHAMLGAAYAKQQQRHKAELHLETASTLDLTARDPRINLGIVRLDQNRFVDAIEPLGEAVRLDPTDPLAPLLLAQGWIGMGDLKKAVSSLQHCLGANPSGHIAIEAHGLLSQQLILGGRFHEAAEHLEIVLKLAPETAWAINNLALICATEPTLANPKRAVELAKMACHLSERREPIYLDTLGTAYAALGQYHRATAAIEEALQLIGSGSDDSFRAELESRMELYHSNKSNGDP